VVIPGGARAQPPSQAATIVGGTKTKSSSQHLLQREHRSIMLIKYSLSLDLYKLRYKLRTKKVHSIIKLIHAALPCWSL